MIAVSNSLTTKEVSPMNINNHENHILIFQLDEYLFGVPASIVERVMRAVQIRELPEAPDSILGVLNFHRTILPVVNIRQRLSLPGCELLPQHRIVVFGGEVPLCFFADLVHGVSSFEKGEIRPPENIYPAMEKYLTGVVSLEENTVLLFDRENLFKGLQLPESLNEMAHDQQ